MKQKLFYILIISVLVGKASLAQNVREVFDFAQEQFRAGNYDIAAKEFNRAFFFDYPEKDVLSLQIAHCYFQQNNYPLAITFYDKAYFLSSNDSLKNECVLGSSFSYIMQGKFILSLNELYNFSETEDKEQETRMNFLSGIALYGNHSDSAAFIAFQKAISLAGISDQKLASLNEEFERVYKYNKRYNPQRSYVMSGLVPGSGQLVIGEVKESLNSMLLIGGLYFLALRVIQLYSFWDGVVALFPWVQRYWMGGMDHAKELANKKIEEKRYESYLNILELTTPKAFQE